MNFDEAREYLHGLTRLGVKLGNERFEALLERLGNPHLGLRVVHVAGTKGKGSTVSFASAILHAAGYRVGSYLSPYVYDLRERVQIDGEMISRDDLARLASSIRPVAEQLAADFPDLGPTTEFELKTAIGFCHFTERNVDYAVIEVGLGGRLDATNVVVDPLVSVITNIGFDHVHLLGDTLDKIAFEKAGIVKNGGICVTGAQEPDAVETIRRVCGDRHARFLQVVPRTDWLAEPDGTLTVTTPRRKLTGLTIGARGDFQFENAALAVRALDEARGPIEISDEAIRLGLAAARIPGRMEIVRTDSPTIVVDAAHNEMAAEALATSLAHEFAADRRPVVFVVGMSKGHEPVEFLRCLLRGFDPLEVALVATEPPFRPRDVGDIVRAAHDVGVRRVQAAPTVIEAAERAVDLAMQLGDSSMIVVTGSFFTIGELASSRWQEIFEERGLNPRIPTDILKAEGQLRA